MKPRTDRSRKRKAQIIGQVFVYTFASIIFVIVLLYGYQAINHFIEQKERVAMIEFKTEIKSVVHSIASTHSVERRSLALPSSAYRLCFIDLRKDPNDIEDFQINIDCGQKPCICVEGEEDYNAMICSSWADQVSKNVFLIPSANLQINVGDISLWKYDNVHEEYVDQGYMCLDVSKQVIYLELEGQGDSTGIKEWFPGVANP
jgi:hypothetical protein